MTKTIKNILIVVNTNDYKTAIEMIEFTKNHKNIDFTVIVDNNSTDGSYDKLKKYEGSKLAIVVADRNGGYGYGNNIGMKYAINKFGKCNLIISNPDVEVKDDVLLQLVTKLNDDEDCAIIAPVILENGKISKGWRLPTINDDVIRNIVILSKKYRDHLLDYSESHYSSKYVEVDCVYGCFFIVKSEIMEQINFFDENIFLYYEENVISKRIKEMNKKLLIDTTVSLFHLHSATLNKLFNQVQKYKMLKKSRNYYHVVYNKANNFQKALLYITTKFSIFMVFFYYLGEPTFKKMKKKVIKNKK